MNEPLNAPSTKPSRTKIVLVVLVTLLAIAFFSVGACFLALYLGMKPGGGSVLTEPPVVAPPAPVEPPNYTPAPEQPAEPAQPTAPAQP